MASLLKSRAVIRFRGPDTWKFLHGLFTNDVRRFGETLGENNISTMYAAMLTPQGRFLYDVFCYKPLNHGSGSDPNHDFELFMDVDGNVVDEMLQSLKKYRLRSKVDIENVAAEFSCWQRYGDSLFQKSSSAKKEEASPVGMSASQGIIPKWNWFNDPRLNCLGFRGIFPSNTTPPLVEIDKETDEENYFLWRLEKGVAEGSTEIPKGEAIPLEYNLVGLKAISFDKGCYVGQEFIARTHHRGIIRKRLVPLKFTDDNGKEVEHTVAPGFEVIVAATGKKAGTVTTARGYRGLGVLRLDEVFKGSNILTIGGHQDIKVHTHKPEWWPSSWLQDLQ